VSLRKPAAFPVGLASTVTYRVAPPRGGRRGVAALPEVEHRRSRVFRARNGARQRRFGIRG